MRWLRALILSCLIVVGFAVTAGGASACEHMAMAGAPDGVTHLATHAGLDPSVAQHAPDRHRDGPMRMAPCGSCCAVACASCIIAAPGACFPSLSRAGGSTSSDRIPDGYLTATPHGPPRSFA